MLPVLQAGAALRRLRLSHASSDLLATLSVHCRLVQTLELGPAAALPMVAGSEHLWVLPRLRRLQCAVLCHQRGAHRLALVQLLALLPSLQSAALELDCMDECDPAAAMLDGAAAASRSCVLLSECVVVRSATGGGAGHAVRGLWHDGAMQWHRTRDGRSWQPIALL
jgi:hypothetical protein